MRSPCTHRLATLFALAVATTCVVTPLAASNDHHPLLWHSDSNAVRNDSVRADSISVPRLALIGGITSAAFIYGHAVLNDLWWKGERSPFHFEWRNDWRYALGADKYGHFFFPALAAMVYADAFRWAGLDTSDSYLVGGGVALAYQTYIEIRDGFSKQWGFSWGDFAADFLGAAYPLARHGWRWMNAFDLKMSFYPSERFRAGSNNSIIDDYESHYQWVALHPSELLPDGIAAYWPRFVNIAIGHSVKELDGVGGGVHEIFLSLDWNLSALPFDGWFWDIVERWVGLYHLPAPAVRISPSVVWYGIHF